MTDNIIRDFSEYSSLDNWWWRNDKSESGCNEHMMVNFNFGFSNSEFLIC